MLNLSISIRNPWYKGKFKSTDYINKVWKLSKNKYFEVQISKFDTAHLFDLHLDLNWNGTDHAGPALDFSIYGYYFMIDVYDHRHWDYEHYRWAEFPEGNGIEY
jgi:hypothetical protein